ncbi:MAG TPA: protein kinase, partial [Candidatus Ozemobacteraceae bacterium]|nr:protein kinase [Candidatus Ozemobacteraceae bacterium]
AAELFQLVFGRAKAPSLPAGSGRLEDWVIGGNYRVLNRMGSGGTASVLRATDLSLNREVALKILLENETTDEELTKRFLAEGKILASLRHPNVVMVYSLGLDQRLKFPFLVMEMVHGATLDDHLEDLRNPLLLFREMITILEAIHFCHQKKIIHLDLKPSNVMIDQNGQIKIIDFGIAIPMQTQKENSFALGTAYYMAPEQFEFDRTFTPETDVYALGIMLWELLTGKVPFSEPAGSADPFDALEQAHRHAEPPFESLEAIPHARALVPLLRRMLAKPPAQRPAIPEIIQLLRQEMLSQGGQIGDRFEVREELHRSPLTRILSGFDRTFQQKVVIEILTAEAGTRHDQMELFLQRAGRLTRLGHPCFSRVVALDREPATRLPYLVQEMAGGLTLADALSLREGDAPRLLRLLLRVLLGLWRAHEAGFGHGLLGLETILVSDDDEVAFIRTHNVLSDHAAITADVQAIPSLGLAFVQACTAAGMDKDDHPDYIEKARTLCTTWKAAIDESRSIDLRQMSVDVERLLINHHLEGAEPVNGAVPPLGKTPSEKLARIKRLVDVGNPVSIRILLDALTGEKDVRVLAAILPALARLERRSELPVVVPFLDHPDSTVRLAAIEAIHLAGAVGACLHLFDLLDDADKRVRTHAASTLKNFGDAFLKEQLQTFALFGLPDQQIQALRALRFFPSEEHLSLIELMSRSENPEIAKAARDARLTILTSELELLESTNAPPPVALRRIESMENHTIVCGYGRKGQMIVQSLLARDEHCVLIENNDQQSGLELARAQGIPTLVGSATHAPLLLAAGVTRARQVFAVTNDDDVNLEIALKTKMLLGNLLRPRHLEPLQCLTHVFSISLACMADLFAPLRTGTRDRFQVLSTAPGFELRLFNIYENAARQILAGNLPSVSGLQDQLHGKPLHVLILGVTNLGVNLAVRVATQLQGPDPGLLKITIVDQSRHLREAAIRFHYPNIDRIVSLNLVPLAEKDLTPEAIERLAGFDPFAAIFVCHQNQNLGQKLGAMVRQFPSVSAHVPMLVVGRAATPAATSTPSAPSGNPATAQNQFARFDLFSATCQVDAILQEPLDQLAHAIHQQFCEGDTIEPNDPRRVPWERLRADVKEHFRAQADHLAVKARTLGCALVAHQEPGRAYVMSDDDVGTLARLEFRRRVVESQFSSSHGASFLETLRETGKDAPTWDVLPQPEREELYRQIRGIPTLLASIGQKMQRL